MSDDSDAALLDRFTSGLHAMQGLELASPARPEQLQTTSNAAWLRQQFDADPQMRRDYLQAAVRHPHLTHCDQAALVSHVEAVVRHFAPDGLTRPDYFKAVAADPSLVLQKPAAVIGNLEAVMDRYAADRLMRSDYVQAAVTQPVLLRTPPEAVFAAIEATVDRLAAEGITRSECLYRAAENPQIFTQGPQAIRPAPATSQPPAAAPPGQVADSSPLPSTSVQNPVLYVSYVADRGLVR